MERLWQVPIRARSATGLNPMAFWTFHRSIYPGSDPDETISTWWRPDRMLADDLARLSRAEDRFDPASTSASASASASAWQDNHPGNLFLPEILTDPARTVLRAQTSHRILLIAVRVLDLAAQAGTLPDHLPTDLDLSGGHDRLPLRYLRRDPSHFAIVEATDDPARPAYTLPLSPAHDPTGTAWIEIDSATHAEPASR
jgi:hypothetical protein